MNGKEPQRTQWHPGFAAAIRIELRENKDDLTFEEEYNLSKKPLQVDVLIIKKNREVQIKNRIGKLFKRYNIVEYKSPDDEMGIDTLYKVIAYACLYKSGSAKENAYKACDITITLIRHRYPQKLVEYLLEEGYEIEKQCDGIYYIAGKILFDIQIIVSKELEEKENIWLHSLQTDISKETYRQLLVSVSQLESKEKELYGEAVLDIVSKANITNIENWKEESEMCATLEKLMEPELEQKKQQAWEDGKREGQQEGRLEGKILAYAEIGLSVADISEKVSLSEDQIEQILAQR